MARGILPRDLAETSTALGGVTFQLEKDTASGTSTYQLFPSGGAPYPLRVTGFGGTMTAAGAGGMTVQLQDKDGNAISDSISLAALPDKAVFDCASLDDAKWSLNKGNNLKIVTDGTAVCKAVVKLVKV